MRLYLDDERPTPDGWARAYTAHEAIAHLATGEVLEVSLDHDLGPPEAGTGYDVAVWIEERVFTDPAYTPPVIHLHTANPVGRARMSQVVANIQRRRG